MFFGIRKAKKNSKKLFEKSSNSTEELRKRALRTDDLMARTVHEREHETHSCLNELEKSVRKLSNTVKSVIN